MLKDKVFLTASCLTLVLLLPARARAQGIIEVSHYLITSKESALPIWPGTDAGDSNGKEPARLFFMTEIVGRQAALNELESNGELPIRHVWRHGVFVIGKRDVGITQAQWLKFRRKLEGEVAAQEYFTWRTFSYKENPTDSYLVSVLDENDSPATEFSQPTRIFQATVSGREKTNGN